MNLKTNNILDEKLIDEIIGTAYRDVSIFILMKVLFLSLTNNHVKKIYCEYRLTAKKVKSIKQDEIPEILLLSTLSKVNHSKKVKILSYDFLYIIFKQPVLSLLFVVVIIASIFYTIITNKSVTTQSFSKQQIELADKQIKYAFSLISDILQKTQMTINENILKNKITKPMHQSMETVYEIVPKQEKNKRGQHEK
ncbi:hypothetical protein ABRY23_10680 [Melioribacteraceae bacterium 4301-Me]|uniref:hypothetical protein n=1 Tax=Pyranulibacter aquaticus TaxID=3163344 RepID=UPI003597054A